MYTPTAKSYFSGAGLMDIGIMRAGIDIKQSLDIDPHAIAAMRRNPKYFSHPVIHTDIKDICVLDQERTDIMIGTYPCNKYSAIGDIHGVRTGDDLYLHFFRHLALEQPEMYILENVPGMKKFKVVMEAMTKIPGYYYNLFCPLNASNWLPQNRERLILIATRKPFSISAPSKAKRRPTIKELLEPNAQVDVNDTVIARIKGEYRDMPIIIDPEDPNSIAPCCVAHYAKDMGTRLVKDIRYKHGVRPFSIREYARLQGVPDDYEFTDQRISYRLIGNGVAVDVALWAGQQAVRYFN